VRAPILRLSQAGWFPSPAGLANVRFAMGVA
jgi:hypothetical protein